MNKPIFVTEPSLPNLDEYLPYLKQIWENKILTNNGPFHQELEAALCKFLGVPYVSLFANGTLALVTALQTLRITGEVITTPYSFVATTHSLWWNNIKPVFVDIEPKYGNIDSEKLEAAITPKTTAILPVHVYGNPCNVERIKEVADTYGLKVLYDAAHAFGVRYKSKSILNFGDLSILSFHATKVFNTFEGGAIICHDLATKKRIDFLKNFGFADELTVVAPGINSKMNEIQAAMGLLQLKSFQKNIDSRNMIAEKYRTLLANISGISFLTVPEQTETNSAYFPIFVDEDYGLSRDALYHKLKENNIFGRRYFYPLISEFSMYRNLESATPHNLVNASKIAKSVICLPIFPNLPDEQLNLIIDVIKSK